MSEWRRDGVNGRRAHAALAAPLRESLHPVGCCEPRTPTDSSVAVVDRPGLPRRAGRERAGE